MGAGFRSAPHVATTSVPCTVHKRHVPPSHVNEVHHVWPLGHNGPNVPENKVVICGTGHSSVHQLLDAWLKVDGDPGWDVRRRYTPGERALAKLGWERIKRQAI